LQVKDDTHSADGGIGVKPVADAFPDQGLQGLSHGCCSQLGAAMVGSDLCVPRLRSRTTGAVVTNTVSFNVDVLPGVSYIAYALSDGCIVVQQVMLLNPATNACFAWHLAFYIYLLSRKPALRCTSVLCQTSTSQAVPGPRVPPNLGQYPTHPHPQSTPLTYFTSGSSLSPGHYSPVLIIEPQLWSTPPGRADAEAAKGLESEAFTHLAWGGGPCYLLAAASKHYVRLFSLRRFFLREEAMAMVQSSMAASASLGLLLTGHTPPSSAGKAALPGAAGGGKTKGLGTSAAAAGGGDVAGGPAMPLPSRTWQLLGSYPLAKPLLAMDWTQDTGGLLLSDEGQRVTMLGVTTGPLDTIHVASGGLPEIKIWEAWSAKSDALHPLIAAGADVGSPSATAHSVATTQRGNNPGDAATSSGIGQTHKVLIWWPHLIKNQAPDTGDGESAGAAGEAPQAAAPKPKLSPAAAAAAAAVKAMRQGTPISAAAQLAATQQAAKASEAASAAGAGSEPGQGAAGATNKGTVQGAAQATQQPRYSIGVEVIRHPARVISLQWSPPLSSGPPANTSSNSTPGQSGPSTSTTGSTPALQSSTSGPPGGTGGTAAGAGGTATPAAVPTPKRNSLALMTVGADWVIRVWVEVVMSDLLPASLLNQTPAPGGNPAGAAAAAAAAAAALSMSQFCLALVIEPPLPSLKLGVRPGLRAAWARPLAPPTHLMEANGDAEGYGSAANSLGLAAVGKGHSGGAASGDLPSSLQQQQLQPSFTPLPSHTWLSSSAAAIASRVHWLVATVAITGEPITSK
jgi:hypothetical protein